MSATSAISGDRRTLFVMGLMRPGTSLLYWLPNNHAQVALLYESDVFTLSPVDLAFVAIGYLAREVRLLKRGAQTDTALM